ncbi:phage major capsid protein [Shumkonia mesophila]|uniref:phage major capsid protein n=1 Tax=Shumkonia mesophila TaxID=2838854 RepID=UPI0029341F7C|nr:hypothetical protein [Shumkonia mesophila]
MRRRDRLVNFREARGVPALGLIGADAIREAFEGDFTQLRDLLQGAVRQALALAGTEDWYPYIQAVFDDNFVVEAKDGRLLKYGYTVDGTKVALGTPVEVKKTYVPVEPAGTRMAEASGAFVEAGKAGGVWKIRVVHAGLSGNNNFYSDATLRQAVPLVEGVRVFVKSDEEHLAGRGKDVRNLIGQLSGAAFVEGATPDSGEIQATLTLIEPEGDVATKLREAWDRGLTGLFGFSIDAVGTARKATRGGQAVREATKIVKVKSVDLIVEPGAGGAVISLVESRKETVMDRQELIALLEAKGLLKGKTIDKLTDDDLKQILREAVADPAAADPGTGDPAGGDLREAVRMVEARSQMRIRIERSTLPAQAKTRLTKKFETMETFTEAEVDQAIKDEVEYLAPFSESGRVHDLGDVSRIESGVTRPEKVAAMFDAFFDPAHKDHRHARSFKECYVSATGDKLVTGLRQNCDQAVLRESLDSASFDDVLGSSIARRMVADYRVPTRYDVWRQFAGTPVPINDFRTQERTRFGGYGDLPTVAQGDPYVALASPTDEKATYAVAKKGGTEDVTLEMIKNDDVGVIRQIPTKLSRAAKRTLGKFVLDFIRLNPAIYDGVAFFHADHGNLGSAALDKTSFAAARLAMLNQTEKDSGDKIGIPPAFLWVGDPLEETGVDLFRRNTEQDKTFVQSQLIRVIPVWYWTDATDWAVTCDPNDIPIVEIGFLDGNEEPEIFVQDSPTGGSMFSHDKLTWKIRHIYGGNVVDFRGAYKAVVAG